MTVHTITLDLSKINQVEYSNIESMTPDQCININVSQAGICEWIQNNGGIHPMTFSNVITLRSAYLNVVNLGFTVTFSHVIGARSYYLNQIPSGNSSTGCAFT
jgi:hypothetical protein